MSDNKQGAGPIDRADGASHVEWKSMSSMNLTTALGTADVAIHSATSANLTALLSQPAPSAAPAAAADSSSGAGATAPGQPKSS